MREREQSLASMDAAFLARVMPEGVVSRWPFVMGVGRAMEMDEIPRVLSESMGAATGAADDGSSAAASTFIPTHSLSLMRAFASSHGSMFFRELSCESTKRKRVRKMNKHKHKKRLKEQRRQSRKTHAQ